jgi:hypothetical protein
MSRKKGTVLIELLNAGMFGSESVCKELDEFIEP